LPVYKDLETDDIVDKSDIILDALFGFSFKGEVRDPYKDIINIFDRTTKPIVSVDIPSGWDVETGPTEHVKFQPDILVSLTAPKQCLNRFKGKRHFLGGRFVPSSLAKQFDFDIPEYPGGEQVVELALHE
jgi:NAD(P)H-hydrate epimerase